MRADLFLSKNGYFETRQKAQKAINSGCITVNQKTIMKSSFNIENSDIIVVNSALCEDLKFVSRGGLKLEKAINEFSLNLKNKICADYGASTGGFTDCMLFYGAKKVYAIDVGTEQLHPKIANNPKVINIEKTNLKTLNTALFNEKLDFIATDVSFISLEHIIPKISENLILDGQSVCLIKPQFEAGKTNIGKGGIVKDKKIHKSVILKIVSLAISNQLSPLKIAKSPILGGDGNTEYLILLQKQFYPELNIDNEKIDLIL